MKPLPSIRREMEDRQLPEARHQTKLDQSWIVKIYPPELLQPLHGNVGKLQIPTEAGSHAQHLEAACLDIELLQPTELGQIHPLQRLRAERQVDQPTGLADE